MINVEIKMVGGEIYRIGNRASNNVKEFIRNVFTPYGGQQMRWAEILKGEFIQVDNIISIRELMEDEITKEFEEVTEEIEEFNEPVESEEYEKTEESNQ